MIILEEAAHLKPQLFHNVIVPLLTVEHTAMLAITSPGDEQNYISVIQDLKNADGEDLFYNIKIGLMCQDCLAQGKDVCKHRRALPDWKSEERQDLVRAVFGQNKNAMKREAEGMVVSDRVYLFGKKDMNEFEKRELYNFEYDVQLIEIGIDPSGGGTQSDYTIVSKCVENGKDIVRISQQRKQLSHTRDVGTCAAIVLVFTFLECSAIQLMPRNETGVHLLQLLHEDVLQRVRLVAQHEAAEQLRVQQHVLNDNHLLIVRIAAAPESASQRQKQIWNLGHCIFVEHFRLHRLQLQLLEQLCSHRLRSRAEKQHVFQCFLKCADIAVYENASQSGHAWFFVLAVSCCCEFSDHRTG